MTFEVRTGTFEGPLDLLLQLLEKAELNIEDVFVSEITSAYLAYVEQMEREDMDSVSEFLTVAAELVYLKSRRMLPAPPAAETEEEEEDPEQAFIERLKVYKLCKERAKELLGGFEKAADSFSRLPEDIPEGPVEAELKTADVSALLKAFENALKAKPSSKEPLKRRVVHDVYTVRHQARRLRNALRKKGSLLFEELFEAGADRMEKVVTFMALLEMMARGEVKTLQHEAFGPIRIKALGLRNDDNDSYMDEEVG